MIGDKCPKCGFVEKEDLKCDCKKLPWIKKKEQKDEQ